ncbi:hypothetical protein LX36DRAFT_193192 [Colletotrichum falcatum]|nr:hypothetical protein LX36DRAFT_193192 [Colletotrichum falcatum]
MAASTPEGGPSRGSSRGRCKMEETFQVQALSPLWSAAAGRDRGTVGHALGKREKGEGDQRWSGKEDAVRPRRGTRACNPRPREASLSHDRCGRNGREGGAYRNIAAALKGVGDTTGVSMGQGGRLTSFARAREYGIEFEPRRREQKAYSGFFLVH